MSGKDVLLAPEGAIWVCGACGRRQHDRAKFPDASCYLWAVLCIESSVVISPETGFVTNAEAWSGV